MATEVDYKESHLGPVEASPLVGVCVDTEGLKTKKKILLDRARKVLLCDTGLVKFDQYIPGWEDTSAAGWHAYPICPITIWMYFILLHS